MMKNTFLIALYVVMSVLFIVVLGPPLGVVHVKLMRFWESQICKVITCPTRD